MRSLSHSLHIRLTGLLYALIGFMTCLLVGIALGFFMRAAPEQLKGLSWKTRE